MIDMIWVIVITAALIALSIPLHLCAIVALEEIKNPGFIKRLRKSKHD